MNTYYYSIIILVIVLILVYIYLKEIRTNILTFLIVQRGILAPNCTWWNISENILKDASGVNFYYDLKKKYGSFVQTNFGGQSAYIVTNPTYIKMILDSSPDLFGVGQLKSDLFKSFMGKNVGVSEGCPWRIRRLNNENVLFSEILHPYCPIYDQHIQAYLRKWIPLNYAQFSDFSRQITMKIVFNDDGALGEYPPYIFQMFSQANSMQAVWFGSKKIPYAIEQNFISYLKKNIRNPRPYSLVDLASQTYNQFAINTNNLQIDRVCHNVKNQFNIEDELINQIPHWIFPIVGVISINLPRLLLLLCNHRQVFDRLIKEINLGESPLGCPTYLRSCILEALRLNNPVITTFRTLLSDLTISDQYSFKKGDQFVILNNPVLRDSSFFYDPHRYLPERWNLDMEKSYFSLMFGQGPQRCPGKELAILLTQLALVNYLKYSGVLKYGSNYIRCNQSIDVKNIPQMINPCNLKFDLGHK